MFPLEDQVFQCFFYYCLRVYERHPETTDLLFQQSPLCNSLPTTVYPALTGNCHISLLRLLQKATGSQDCEQSCLDWAEWMKCKALRVRCEGSVLAYVTKPESREQRSNSPLCNSLLLVAQVCALTLIPIAAKNKKSKVRLRFRSAKHARHTLVWGKDFLALYGTTSMGLMGAKRDVSISPPFFSLQMLVATYQLSSVHDCRSDS